MDLEEAKKQRMEELKKKYSEQETERQKAAEVEAQISLLLKQVLDEKAMERLSNVKLVKKELYLLAAQNLIYLAKKGEIEGKLNDSQLKQLLERLSAGTKKEIRIKRK